jgi:hypothetical protein
LSPVGTAKSRRDQKDISGKSSPQKGILDIKVTLLNTVINYRYLKTPLTVADNNISKIEKDWYL